MKGDDMSAGMDAMCRPLHQSERLPSCLIDPRALLSAVTTVQRKSSQPTSGGPPVSFLSSEIDTTHEGDADARTLHPLRPAGSTSGYPECCSRRRVVRGLCDPRSRSRGLTLTALL